MMLSIKDFFSKCNQIRRNLRFGHIYFRNLNGKLHFLCSDFCKSLILDVWQDFEFAFAAGKYFLKKLSWMFRYLSFYLFLQKASP